MNVELEAYPIQSRGKLALSSEHLCHVHGPRDVKLSKFSRQARHFNFFSIRFPNSNVGLNEIHLWDDIKQSLM